MPASASTSPERLPTCACGTDRNHHYARPSLKYGGGGWFLLFSGASAVPKEITFRCARCGEVFETTRDPAVLEAFKNH